MQKTGKDKPTCDISAGVILAGGAGRRFGGVMKALLPIKASSPGEATVLLELVLARVRAQLGLTLLSVGEEDTPALAAFGLPIVRDGEARGKGPLAGVEAASRYCLAHDPDRRFLVSLPCDGPLLPLDLAKQLLARQKQSGAGLVIAASGGRLHPTFALWDLENQELARARGEALAGEAPPRLQDFAIAQRAAVVDWGQVQPDPFLNINTPTQLSAFEIMLEKMLEKPGGKK